MDDETSNQILRYIREMRADMTRRFDRVDGRFDGMDVRFEGVDGWFVKIEARLSDLTGLMHALRADILGLATRLDKIETSARQRRAARTDGTDTGS